MLNLLNSVYGFMWNMLGADIFKKVPSEYSTNYGWVDDIVDFLNASIVPIIITLSIAGALLVIFLSVLMVKAESTADASKYKKRIFGILATIAIVIVLLFFLGWLLPNLPYVINEIRGVVYLPSS